LLQQHFALVVDQENGKSAMEKARASMSFYFRLVTEHDIILINQNQWFVIKRYDVG
jgi:hypothetical protein